MLMEVTEVGIGTEVREVQVLNALETMEVTVVGTVTEMRDVQEERPSITVTEVGKVKEVKEEHL